MRVAILGFTIPNDVFSDISRSDPVLPAQTHAFAWALVDSLRRGGVEKVDLLSSYPVTSYPGNRRLLWPGVTFKAARTHGILMPFLNVTLIKHATRFWSCWVYARPRLNRTRPEWLLVHGVHSPFLWFAAIYRGLHPQTQVAVVLTDPPGVPAQGEGGFTRALRRLDVRLVRAALSRYDAAICLTKQLGLEYAPGSPHLVMEGISTAPQTPSSGLRRSGKNPLFVYAGGLSREYGIDVLLNAVLESSLDIELRVFGKGPEAEAVARAAATDSRVKGPEVVGRGELAHWYEAAAALIQPRPVDQSFTSYSFPSKLIEYMGAGRPVISTRLPSIPADYEPYVLWADQDDSVSLRSVIGEVVAMSPEQRDEFGGRAAQFIRSTRSPEAQGIKIVEFLRGVEHDSR